MVKKVSVACFFLLVDQATTEDCSVVQLSVCSGCGKKSKEGCSEGKINDRRDK